MELTLYPAKLKGSITPPPSKSQAHRLIIGAALGEGSCTIRTVAFSQDILATLGAMEQLGAKWESLTDDTIRISGMGGKSQGALPHLDCGESGSTLRFLIPIALAAAGGGSFTGRRRLMERPQQPYLDLFDEKGIAYSSENGVLTVNGSLPHGEYALRGDVSSQFFTGLLYALPLVKGDSIIRSTTAPESRSYIDMTLDALQKCGIDIAVEGDCFRVKGGQVYHLTDCAVEADWSQAGFFYAAKGIGNDIEIEGMNAYSVQGDMKIVPYYLKMLNSGDVTLDVSDCPDLVPPLAVQAALRGEGNTTYITNAARLRIKESDRLTAVTTVLNALGAHIEELADGLVIHGKDGLAGGVTVSSVNDHSIAMMTEVAATRGAARVKLGGADREREMCSNFSEDRGKVGREAEQ